MVLQKPGMALFVDIEVIVETFELEDICTSLDNCKGKTRQLLNRPNQLMPISL
jgi:hypothetical protein